jgi:Cdc6-like AAA superfamily ATPase
MTHDHKKKNSAYNYKHAIPYLSEHYSTYLGHKIDLYNADTTEVRKAAELYGLDGKYSEYGKKGNGTYRNALNGLLRMKTYIPINKLDIKDLIKTAITDPRIQELINDNKFYFQYLIDVKDKYFSYEISNSNIEKIIIDYRNFEDGTFEEYVIQSENSIKPFLEILAEYICYLDSKASGKNRWNKYNDKRTIAKASVRMPHWVNSLLQLKINPNSDISSSISNGVNYSISPMTHLTILSKNHRKDLSNNLLEIEYNKTTFHQEIIDYFKPFNISPRNQMNYTYIISSILYSPNIKSIWFSKEGQIIEENQNHNTISETGSKYVNPSRTKTPLNQILYGPPGTGKTYKTKKLAVEIIEGINYSDSKEDRIIILKKYNEYVESENIHFTTFHQSMSYEDFIEGIKPETIDNQVTYDVKDGVFKEICEKAKVKKESNFEDAYQNLLKEINEIKDDYLLLKTPTGKEFRVNINSNNNLNLYTSKAIKKQGTLTKEKIVKQINGFDEFSGWEGYVNSVINYLKTNHNLVTVIKNKKKENYVLIIDEINRGNVSAIFGELITLIETDKRAGQKEAISVILPYSKERFSVPNNIYIIGTMNTADRSVEALDTALRRRFSFEEILPKPALLNELDYKDINLELLLDKINQRIELLVDKDHQIGHSYFFNINSLDDLKLVFKDKILPLLEEYFYGDFGKIGLVLGENFITPSEVKNKSVLASFKDYEDIDFISDKKIFRLKNINEMKETDFVSIYQVQDR